MGVVMPGEEKSSELKLISCVSTSKMPHRLGSCPWTVILSASNCECAGAAGGRGLVLICFSLCLTEISSDFVSHGQAGVSRYAYKEVMNVEGESLISMLWFLTM